MPPLPNGDVLLHCGDFSMGGREPEVRSYNKWITAQPHPIKLTIAGNHELGFDSMGHKACQKALSGCRYIQDEVVELPGGIKLYGSPWTPHCGRS